MIDYVLGDERAREGIESMMVEGAIDSQHRPIVVWIKGEGEKERGKMKKGGRRSGVWNEEGKRVFVEGLG